MAIKAKARGEGVLCSCKKNYRDLPVLVRKTSNSDTTIPMMETRD